MMTTTATLIDIAAVTTPRPVSCGDCVAAYAAIAEMNRSAAQTDYDATGTQISTDGVPLPVVLEATCPWPVDIDDVELCLPHATARKGQAFRQLLASDEVMQ